MVRNQLFSLALLICSATVASAAHNTPSVPVTAKLKKSAQSTGAPGGPAARIPSITAKFNTVIHRTGAVAAPRPQSALSLGKQLALPAALDSSAADGNGHATDVVVYDDLNGTPRSIDVHQALLKQSAAPSTPAMARDRARAFLTDNRNRLKITDPQNEFTESDTKVDDLGMIHIRYQQTYQGIPVWGKEAIIHVNAQGRVASFTGRIRPTIRTITGTTSAVDMAAAIALVKRAIAQNYTLDEAPSILNTVLKYAGPTAQKILWDDPAGTAHLAWFVNYRNGLSQNWYYFIDARTGSILNFYNNICNDGPAVATGTDLNSAARSFNTYLSGGQYYMIDASQPMFNPALSTMPTSGTGTIECFTNDNKDMGPGNPSYYFKSTTSSFNDPAAVSALCNAVTTYRFFRDAFNRNSIDDKGMSIYSFVHATENGTGMDNAYWNGLCMVYGDGATEFKPLSGSLDVAAHEMAHGVNNYAANLEYQGQSGALSESFSDVIGALLDSTNWLIGEQVIKNFSSYPSGALRDMANPHNGGTSSSDGCWQPAHMNDFLTTKGDNGGVHVNSGIPNHAFYLVATSIGRDKAGKIWYRAETNYLTRTSQFLDARLATEKSAADLFGGQSTELAAIKTAWNSVGVLTGIPDTAEVPGQLTGNDWILALNTDTLDPNTLYGLSPSIPLIHAYPLSITAVSNRPAVSDTSGIILFIDGNNNLRMVIADTTDPQETVLDSSGIWKSVAIGPGLNSIALTTTQTDTTVYYLDLVDSTKSAAVKIRIPTPGGVDSKTALYADALTFDPSGRYVLFDTYNQINTGIEGDSAKNFWNINMLDVQTGIMSNVFPALPAGKDIGNPSFSKTSFSRFTFDSHDVKNNIFAVMAADFNTGEIGIVADSLNDWGYPTYSGDDNMIAYHDYRTTDGTTWHHLINQKHLKPNRLEAVESDGLAYLKDGMYPVWFVIGGRTTHVAATVPLARKAALTVKFSGRTTAFSIATPSAGRLELSITDLMGRRIINKTASITAARTASIPLPATLGRGMYVARVHFTGLSGQVIRQSVRCVIQ